MTKTITEYYTVSSWEPTYDTDNKFDVYGVNSLEALKEAVSKIPENAKDFSLEISWGIERPMTAEELEQEEKFNKKVLTERYKMYLELKKEFETNA